MPIKPDLKFIGDISFDKVLKQVTFGTAKGLTRTAQGGQGASQKSIKARFNVRTNWTDKKNKYGIRIKPATKTDLRAEVSTEAWWLLDHEEGGTRTGSLAIPTGQPSASGAPFLRGKAGKGIVAFKRVIPAALKPRALRGKAFVLDTSSGRVLFIRVSGAVRSGRASKTDRKSQLIALYNLERNAKIKKQSTFYEPIEKHVERNVDKNISMEIDAAMRTAK